MSGNMDNHYSVVRADDTVILHFNYDVGRDMQKDLAALLMFQYFLSSPCMIARFSKTAGALVKFPSSLPINSLKHPWFRMSSGKCSKSMSGPSLTLTGFFARQSGSQISQLWGVAVIAYADVRVRILFRFREKWLNSGDVLS
jgi:hypothetical protein